MEVNNLDHSKILNLIDKVDKLGKEVHDTLSAPMLASIPEMFLSSAEVFTSIGTQVTNAQKQALEGFNTVFKGIIDHIDATKNKLAAEKPSDFKVAPIEDLRETIATGFPRENPLFFTELPTIKF